MPTTLFRPVGLHELALIWDSGMHEFPPRLPHQPVFYPVANAEYARQIARDWNTRDEKSGFAGFVTEFAIDSGYIAKFAPHVVGALQHQEYWIPAEELGAFNKAISGRIRVREGFFGPNFVGCVPDGYALKGKDAATQMAPLVKTWDHSTFDVTCEISANRKSVYLNSLFWAQHDFSEVGVSRQQRDDFISHLKKLWESITLTRRYRDAAVRSSKPTIWAVTNATLFIGASSSPWTSIGAALSFNLTQQT